MRHAKKKQYSIDISGGNGLSTEVLYLNSILRAIKTYD